MTNLQFLSQDSWLMKTFFSTMILRGFSSLFSLFCLRVMSSPSPPQHLENNLCFPWPLILPFFISVKTVFLFSLLSCLFYTCSFSHGASLCLKCSCLISPCPHGLMLPPSLISVLQILPNTGLKIGSCLCFWDSSYSQTHICVDHCLHWSTEVFSHPSCLSIIHELTESVKASTNGQCRC